jgi:hypothetical protein
MGSLQKLSRPLPPSNQWHARSLIGTYLFFIHTYNTIQACKRLHAPRWVSMFENAAGEQAAYLLARRSAFAPVFSFLFPSCTRTSMREGVIHAHVQACVKACKCTSISVYISHTLHVHVKRLIENAVHLAHFVIGGPRQA